MLKEQATEVFGMIAVICSPLLVSREDCEFRGKSWIIGIFCGFICDCTSVRREYERYKEGCGGKL